MDNLDDIQRMVERKTSELMEHCDSVMVFVTKADKSQTFSYAWGDGNYFARRGQITMWLEQSSESNKVDVRNSEENYGDDYEQ